MVDGDDKEKLHSIKISKSTYLSMCFKIKHFEVHFSYVIFKNKIIGDLTR